MHANSRQKFVLLPNITESMQENELSTNCKQFNYQSNKSITLAVCFPGAGMMAANRRAQDIRRFLRKNNKKMSADPADNFWLVVF